MVQPNFIPRTLRGVGGVRLINMPGVEYPSEVLHVRAGHNRSNGRPFKERPDWGISTSEAAALLHCSTSAARSTLHRKRVRCRVVSNAGIPRALFWDRKQVDALVGLRHPIIESPPDKFLTPDEACRMLAVGRSSLYRYAKRRWLRPLHVRQKTAQGMRHRVYYRRAEVVKLGNRLRALKARMDEMRRLLRDMVAGGED